MKTREAIIAKAYQVFSGHRPGEYLDASVCCMSESSANELKSIALQQIPLGLLQAYQDAAKPEQLEKEELKYFAPRYLEFILNYQFPSFEPLLSLSRFGKLAAQDWTKEERALLEAFALFFFQDYLNTRIQNVAVLPIDILLMFYKRLVRLHLNWLQRANFILHFVKIFSNNAVIPKNFALFKTKFTPFRSISYRRTSLKQILIFNNF